MAVTTSKTVFILGAGFSAPAGGPSQATLLKEVFKPFGDVAVQKNQETLRQFLVETLKLDVGHLDQVSLEDVFTPIDRCLADGLALRGSPPPRLEEVRASLQHLIAVAIDASLRGTSHDDKGYLRDFAGYVVELASERLNKAAGKKSAQDAKDCDPVALISLNWDIAFDRALHNELERHDSDPTSDYAPMGVVDYCCYISSLEETDRRIRPGLWALGARGFNVKLLKIHGSMNWLQCSNCQRLYVGFDDKLVIPNYLAAQPCRHCKKHKIDADLQVSLVMPTFLKDLSNFQVKLVWQNAGIELMEATKVVFIGYSLPQADFEFRQLLTRMLPADAEIEVILWDNAPEFIQEKKRYENFFGNGRASVKGFGVKEYVRQLF